MHVQEPQVLVRETQPQIDADSPAKRRVVDDDEETQLWHDGDDDADADYEQNERDAFDGDP